MICQIEMGSPSQMKITPEAIDQRQFPLTVDDNLTNNPVFEHKKL